MEGAGKVVKRKGVAKQNKENDQGKMTIGYTKMDKGKYIQEAKQRGI